MAPVIDSISTGKAAASHGSAIPSMRSSILACPPEGIANPVRSPFRSARNTGTPAADSSSAMTCNDLVLPVPVAPAIKPCLLRAASGALTVTVLTVDSRSPESGRPKVIEASGNP